MLDWFRRRRAARADDGDAIDPRSPLGKLLVAEAARLSSTGLDGRVERWLLAGDDEQVLRKIAASPAAVDCLKARCSFGGFLATVPEEFVQLWRTRHALLEIVVTEGEPEVLWRLGQLYAAATPKGGLAAFHRGTELPDWLNALLWEGTNEFPNSWSSNSTTVLAAPALVAALVAAGEPPELVVDLILGAAGATAYDASRRASTWRMAAIPEVLAELRGRVAEFLAAESAEALAGVLTGIRHVGADPGPWIDRIAELACDARKTVSSAATALVESSWPAAELRLRAIAVEAGTAERGNAMGLLLRLGNEAVRDFVAGAAAEDRSKKVRDMVAAQLADHASVAAEEVTVEFEVPPRSGEPEPGPLAAAQLEDLEVIGRAWEEQLRKLAASSRGVRSRPRAESFDARRRDALAASIGARGAWSEVPEPLLPGLLPMQRQPLDAVIEERCARGEWSLVQILRLTEHLQGGTRSQLQALVWRAPSLLTAIRERRGVGWDLRDLQDASTACGIDPEVFARALLAAPHEVNTLLSWGSAAVWPFLLEHVEIFAEQLSAARTRDRDRPWLDDERFEACLRAARSFPRLPRRLAVELWPHALGTGKQWRSQVQQLLVDEPDLRARLEEALRDGQQAVRAVAADWIAELRHEALADVVEEVLQKEKSDAARAAMLTALERCGRDVERYLDRDGLPAEARKLLKKLAKGCEWLGTVTPPEVHWADSGVALEPDVIRGWLVKAAKLKSPEPDPLLRRYVWMLRESERHALGEFLLAAWIAEDTALPRGVSDEQRSEWRNQAQSWASYYPGKTVDEVVAGWERAFLEKPLGSATASKGVLAVVAACGGPGLAGPAERYIRKWHGHRVHQSKALLAMLAWADDQAATQAVLGIAVRFRTAGIRKEAERLAGELAERKGWTMDELADRTLPTAGFDAAGRQELCYRRPAPEGEDPEDEAFVSRRLELQLLDDLSVRITRDDGKVVKSLPAARSDEAEASVKDAKKALSASKKALKQTVQQQTMRLREAMCTQRAWPVADWRRFLAAHPVVGKLCRRLIWTGTHGDSLTVFRPLDDGTLTSVDDDEVELPADCEIRLAHSSVLGDEATAAWQQHLADFEVDPLFGQFPSVFAELPEGWESLRKLETRQGWMTTAFKLRGRATKLGYTRGAAADAGIFTTYEKAYPSLGLQAVLEFTGSALPEEERDVAVMALYFTRSVEAGGFGASEANVRLGEVPRVLLDESRADYAAVAAEGPGFAADWETRGGW